MKMHRNNSLNVSLSQSSEAIEDWLIAQLSEQLEVDADEIDVHEPFNNYGLNSRQALQLLSKLELWLECRLSPMLIWNYPTIKALAQHLAEASPTVPRSLVKDLNAEVVLDPSINPKALPAISVTEPSAIFLTGATGFLGAFLLQELLQQTQADIYCLVRAANYTEGKKRLQDHLKSYLLWQENLDARIIPVIGSLSQKLLGLSTSEFQQMAERIDVIYHSGALLNFSYPYESFKTTNVLGTQEILRLASFLKLKPLHYVSTMGVFLSIDYPNIELITEDTNPIHSQRHCLGYLQSKWVAEKLVALARCQGLPTCIYRPTWIMGHSQTGVSNTNDFVCTLIKGCIQLKSAPYLNMKLDMAPVDYVSSAIVHLSRQETSLGKAFHLCNPKPLPWNQMTEWIRSLGYPLQLLPYNKWETELTACVSSDIKNVFYPLLPLFDEVITEVQSTIPEIYLQHSWPQIDYQNTLEGLANTDITCPLINSELLDIYFSHFQSSNFLADFGAVA